MPSKKKGGRGKKQLTEEEKSKQAEMKALAEKEKLVRRKRLTNSFLKLKKQKEYEILKVNDNKLLDLWRPRLRKMKLEELLDDYKLYKAAFERNYRKKDDLIADLEELLRNNDEEYNNAFDMHLHNIDKLLEFYKNRLKEVRELYAEHKEKLINALMDEKNRLYNYQEKSLKYLNGVMNAVNMRYKEMASESKAELFVRQEDMRNKAMEEVYSAKQETDRKMDSVWDEIRTILMEYDTKINPLRKEYRELKEKDDKVVGEIDFQFRKMYKLQMSIENIAEKDRAYCHAFQELINDLTRKRDTVREKYELAHQRMMGYLKLGKDNIRHLAIMTGKIIENLDQQIDQRDRLLKCVERCRKHERLDEKVDPFMQRWNLTEYRPMELAEVDKSFSRFGMNETATAEIAPTPSDPLTFIPEKISHIITCECDPCTCEIDEDKQASMIFDPLTTLHQYKILERFWIRYNRASLERAVLAKRKEEVMKDNHSLKLALRNYMGGLNPLQHDIETFSGELMNSAKRNYQMMIQSMQREWRRKERCRKVGGLRVH